MSMKNKNSNAVVFAEMMLKLWEDQVAFQQVMRLFTEEMGEETFKEKIAAVFKDKIDDKDILAIAEAKDDKDVGLLIGILRLLERVEDQATVRDMLVRIASGNQVLLPNPDMDEDPEKSKALQDRLREFKINLMSNKKASTTVFRAFYGNSDINNTSEMKMDNTRVVDYLAFVYRVYTDILDKIQDKAIVGLLTDFGRFALFRSSYDKDFNKQLDLLPALIRLRDDLRLAYTMAMDKYSSGKVILAVSKAPYDGTDTHTFDEVNDRYDRSVRGFDKPARLFRVVTQLFGHIFLSTGTPENRDGKVRALDYELSNTFNNRVKALGFKAVEVYRLNTYKDKLYKEKLEKLAEERGLDIKEYEEALNFIATEDDLMLRNLGRIKREYKKLFEKGFEEYEKALDENPKDKEILEADFDEYEEFSRRYNELRTLVKKINDGKSRRYADLLFEKKIFLDMLDSASKTKGIRKVGKELESFKEKIEAVMDTVDKCFDKRSEYKKYKDVYRQSRRDTEELWRLKNDAFNQATAEIESMNAATLAIKAGLPPAPPSEQIFINYIGQRDIKHPEKYFTYVKFLHIYLRAMEIMGDELAIEKIQRLADSGVDVPTFKELRQKIKG